MSERTFSAEGHQVHAQRDGDWWVLRRAGDERRATITEDRFLAAVLSELLGSSGAEPSALAKHLADEMLRSQAEIPVLERTGADCRPLTEVAAIDWMVEHVPELAPLLHAHLDYNEELLPYVVFEGDFTRWFIDAVRRGNDHMARRFCDAIETLLATETDPPGDDPVWNLAGVAFTEALVMGGENDVIARARRWFGEATSRDIDYMLLQRG